VVDAERLTVLALGVPVGVSITGERAAEAAAAIRQRWDQAATALAPVRELELHLSADAGAPASTAPGSTAPGSTAPGSTVPGSTVQATDPPRRRYSSLPALLDSFSSLVTLQGIEERSRDLLLLHASGLADPRTGLTVASVAASGTGKTTLSRSAAGRLDYVSDETVGVADDGAVVRYPKPLSVKVPGSATKDQISPADAGLVVAGGTSLRLARIVLLDRSDDHAETRVEPVDLFEAVLTMVPEMSYLGRLERPLQRIAGLVAATGGVVRVSYSESATVVRELERLVLRTPASPALVDQRTADTVAAWDASFRASTASEGEVLLTAPLDDLLVDEEAGRSLVFAAGRVLLVSAVAAAVLYLARDGVSPADLRAAVVRVFGDPPAAADGSDPFSTTVATLRRQGLLGS
jgi:hypothetical protein